MKKVYIGVIIVISIVINLFVLKIIFPGIYLPITNLFLEKCIDLELKDIKKLNSFFGVEAVKGDYKYWCNLKAINNRFYNSGNDTLNGVSLASQSELPKEIGKLINLKSLELPNEYIIGNIPESFGNLKKLNKLLLENNKLSGNIPKSLGGLKKLKYLNLGNNKLSGNIPSELGNLIKLRDLILEKNNLSGSIPKELGKLKSLTELNLRYNDLKGDIPKEILELKNIIILKIN